MLSADPTRKLILEGSRSIFVDEKTFFLVLKDGTVYPVDILVDGKTVSKLMVSPPLAQTSIPSLVRNIGNDHIFIGSTVGPSVLLKAARVEEEVEGNEVEEIPTAIVREDDAMEYDDEDEGLQIIHECLPTLIFMKTYMVFLPNPNSTLLPMDWRMLKLRLRRPGRSFICL
jgi:cleavage and polyadenylation specificity factor subunit 1